MNEEEKLSLEDISKMDFGPSIIDILLDEDNDENIVLYDEDNVANEFEQIAVIPFDETIYAILKPVGEMPGVSEDEAIVFAVREFEGEFYLEIEADDKIAEAVFDKYNALCD